MTLDEAIKHSKEVAYQKDLESGFETDYERYAMTDKERTACKECAKEHRQLAEWLEELKQLREQTRWIPVSEGLPKKSGWYLTTVEFDTGHGFVTELLKDFFCDEPQAWANYGEDIIAWLPLPKPYNAENEE